MDSMSHKVDCLHCRLSELCIPQGLAKQEIAQLTTVVKSNLPIMSEEYLYRQNDISKSLYVVRSGSFRSFITDVDGGEQTISFYLPGELMGLDSMHNGRFHCSVIAMETATVCELPLLKLNDICNKIPSLQSQLNRIIGKEIVSDHEKIVLLGNRTATEKMATFLLMISQRYKSLGYSGAKFNLSMRRYDIANFLGLTIETVSRQLAKLSKQGIITVDQRDIHILNMESLKAIVEPCLPR